MLNYRHSQCFAIIFYISQPCAFLKYKLCFIKLNLCLYKYNLYFIKHNLYFKNIDDCDMFIPRIGFPY